MSAHDLREHLQGSFSSGQCPELVRRNFVSADNTHRAAKLVRKSGWKRGTR